jgi:hypothetical protein
MPETEKRYLAAMAKGMVTMNPVCMNVQVRDRENSIPCALLVT